MHWTGDCISKSAGCPQGADGSTCFFAVEICISPSTLPSVLRPLIRLEHQGSGRERKHGGEGLHVRPPALRILPVNQIWDTFFIMIPI
jgi:hypothetical protein